MTIGTVLFAALTASPEFQAVAGDRVYPVWLPQSAAYPSVAYTIISNALVSGCSDEKNPRVQVTLFAKTYTELDALDAAVQSALHEYSAPGVYIEYLDGRDAIDNQSEVFYRPTDYRVELSPLTS